MIADQQTNTVYFSDVTFSEFRREMKELTVIIQKAGYKVNELMGTDDYYCRDFMPVQVSKNDLVQFVFRPASYFSEETYEYISNPVFVEIVNPNQFARPRYSPIILDGGSLVKWENKVILTEKVLKDNRYQFPNDQAVIDRLKFDLSPVSSVEKTEIILIPEYPGEETGHADGLLRFADANTVFINDTKTEPEKEWLKKTLSILAEHHIKHIDFPCELKENAPTADGLYINYLQIGKLIIVPQFGFKSPDKQAVEIMKSTFGKMCQIVPLKANWIAEYSGVFNCMSWTVQS